MVFLSQMPEMPWQRISTAACLDGLSTGLTVCFHMMEKPKVQVFLKLVTILHNFFLFISFLQTAELQFTFIKNYLPSYG